MLFRFHSLNENGTCSCNWTVIAFSWMSFFFISLGGFLKVISEVWNNKKFFFVPFTVSFCCVTWRKIEKGCFRYAELICCSFRNLIFNWVLKILIEWRKNCQFSLCGFNFWLRQPWICCDNEKFLLEILPSIILAAQLGENLTFRIMVSFLVCNIIWYLFVNKLTCMCETV